MAENYPHVISCRLSNEEGLMLSALRAATGPNSWSAAIRFLLNDPVCVARIQEFIEAGEQS